MSAYAYRSNYKSKNNRSSFGGSRSSKRGDGQYIDPARFVRVAKGIEQVQYQPTHLFDDFQIEDLLKSNLIVKGFSTPTPIQDQTIPLALEGKDIIGIASTGTGKTAAFAIPVLNNLIKNSRNKALIVAPTRELAQQIEEEIRSLAKGTGLLGAVLIGGAPIGPQLRDLKSNPEIVIGTPGRIKDHLERRSLNLSGFHAVVLDEVDRMLDMGFVNDVKQLLSELSADRQSYYFSATLDARVNTLIQTFSNDPVTVSIKAGESSDNVHQDVVRFESTSDKMDKLHDVLLKSEVEKVLVFDKTQRSVERLSKDLNIRGFQTDAIHGGKSQGQRQRALKRFKTNEVSILIATDVAARGIDISDITHVINYTTPQSYDDYVHRVGRAGRAGRVGYALTFVSK